MAVHVNKNNPQIIIISSENALGEIVEVGEVSITYAPSAGGDVATLAITPTATVATLGGTTAAVTLTLV